MNSTTESKSKKNPLTKLKEYIESNKEDLIKEYCDPVSFDEDKFEGDRHDLIKLYKSLGIKKDHNGRNLSKY